MLSGIKDILTRRVIEPFKRWNARALAAHRRGVSEAEKFAEQHRGDPSVYSAYLRPQPNKRRR